MFGGRDIEKTAQVIEDTVAGPLVEIRFVGKHWDGCGNELIDFVRQTVQELNPAGVMMNLSGFKYRAGNDIGALLFPLFDKVTRRFRPFCIIATGRTARYLKSLFEILPDLVNARNFDSPGDGLEYLKKELLGDAV